MKLTHRSKSRQHVAAGLSGVCNEATSLSGQRNNERRSSAAGTGMVYSYLATGERRGFAAHSSRDSAIRFLIGEADAEVAPHLHLSRDGQYLIDGAQAAEGVFCIFDTEARAREFLATHPGAGAELERSLRAALRGEHAAMAVSA